MLITSFLTLTVFDLRCDYNYNHFDLDFKGQKRSKYNIDLLNFEFSSCFLQNSLFFEFFQIQKTMKSLTFPCVNVLSFLTLTKAEKDLRDLFVTEYEENAFSIYSPQCYFSPSIFSYSVTLCKVFRIMMMKGGHKNVLQ